MGVKNGVPPEILYIKTTTLIIIIFLKNNFYILTSEFFCNIYSYYGY